MKTNKNITIYIDESGTLLDPKDPVVIVAAVGSENAREIAEITKRVRKSSQTKKLPEIKFYRSGEKTKLKYRFKLITFNV